MSDRLAGKRVTLMGLGTRGGGLGIARYLVEQGAIVTVTDLRTPDLLTEPLADLAGLPIRFVLGEHRTEDFVHPGADLIVRNPGVPRRAPLLELARSHGLPVEMEMTLFFRACPAPIIGVTGAKGKTTVATLCGAMLRAWDPRAVLAGNMGISALDQLERITADTPVVIEVSNWQLEGLREHQLSPHIAVLTLIAPDHLNTYDDFADYAATKRSIAHHLRADDFLVVNADDPEAWRAAAETRAKLVPFGLADRGDDGAWLCGEHLVWRWAGDECTFALPATLPFTGPHNQANALAALAAAMVRGAPPAAIAAGLREFGGVRDRMERIAEIRGVTFINDTTATAPIATAAALRALPGRRIHLIAGGADKKLDPTPLVTAVTTGECVVYLLDGTATPALSAALRAQGVAPHGPFASMTEVVQAAMSAAVSGDVVLLSPGCASFGLFRDEFERGDRFREAVRALDAVSLGESALLAPPNNLLPPAPARVHFVGIGGIGMSGLARILLTRGYQVSGSDAAESVQTVALVAEGIPVTIGHEATAPAAGAALVVITAAVREDNPEVAAARAVNVPIIKRAALLGMLANARRCVAVAGSHGKSTTSGMLVTALRALGADPSFAIGATLGSDGANAAPGSGREMVVEADEYDHSFLQLTPDLAIVTNIDYDHPDLFPDQGSYDTAFARFVGQIRPGGTLIMAADDPGCRRLRDRDDWPRPPRLITFGEHSNADWQLVSRLPDAGTSMPLDRPGETTDWSISGSGGVEMSLALAVPGRHNGRNAIAALAALVALGHAPDAAARALATFGGVGRRFEFKGEAGGVRVIDDYAHHPTEISATLRAARDRYPARRLWAVFQPHTFSRLKALLPEFATACTAADQIMLLDVYASRETDHLGMSTADLLALLPAATLRATTPADAATRLATRVAPGDLVVTLGAGDVTETGPLLLAALSPKPTPTTPARGETKGRGRTPVARAARPSTETIPGYSHLKLQRDSPMSLHTTWRVGGPADLLVRAAVPDDLRAAIAWAVDEDLPITVIGGGSNLLVGDRGIRGLVILARTPGERAERLVQVEDLGEVVRLRVGAQAPLSWTGRYAAERGWAGLDWGVGLPGTIGGATVNNAGAHETEQKDHLERIVLLEHATGLIVEQPVAWLEAAYRHTILKAMARPRPYTVLEVIMCLPKGDPVALVRLADAHADFRKRTQPGGATGGSTFANPPGDYAGRLLEEAELKGFGIGGAAFSRKHSNWIVNDGTATAAHIRELIATARARIDARCGISLRAEIEEIGVP